MKREHPKIEKIRRLLARALDPRTPEPEAVSCARRVCERLQEALGDREIQRLFTQQRVKVAVGLDRSGPRTHLRCETITLVEDRPREWKDIEERGNK